MLFPWYAVAMLVCESTDVIALRLRRIAGGGREAFDQTELMVGEKVDACFQAAGSLCGGASIASVIDQYRVRVAANAKRLAIC